MKKSKMVSVFTSGYVNTETILHFFYKITNERGTKTVFTYVCVLYSCNFVHFMHSCVLHSCKMVFIHVKWFYGQSERTHYLNYFIKNYNEAIFIIDLEEHCGK